MYAVIGASANGSKFCGHTRRDFLLLAVPQSGVLEED